MRGTPPETLPRLRAAADAFIHHRTTELVLLVLILASVLAVILEMLTPAPWSYYLWLLGDVLTAVFIVELLIRFWVAPKKKRFFQRYWLDILAVIPVARPLRFFRVLRVLRLWRAGVLVNRRLSGFHGSVQGTAAELLSVAVGAAVLVVSAAMLLFVVESPPQGELDSFRDALWFATLSFVASEPIGADPQSELGRWTTLLLMLGGLTLFGMFVGTVSAGMVARLSRNLEVHLMDIDELKDHVIVAGWNGAAGTVLKDLFGPGTPPSRSVVLVTEQEEIPADLPAGLPRERLYHHVGDYTLVDVLEAIGVRAASQILLLADGQTPRSPQDQDARTVLAALTIERMVPGIYTVVELHSRQSEELLRMAGVEEIIIGDWYAGSVIAASSRNEGLVGVLEEILSPGNGNEFHTLVLAPRWDGRRAGELRDHLVANHRALLVSVERGERPARKQYVNPDSDLSLRSGDRAVVLSRGRPDL